MMASLVSCGRRLWVRAARVFVAVVVAVGMCVVRVHVAWACLIVCVSVILFERIDA